MRPFALTAVVLILFGMVAAAAEPITVPGSNVSYPPESTASIGNGKHAQKLTGAAMRKKVLVNVYTVGSYCATDFTGKTAEDLAGADIVKQLHIVLVRDVSGADMARAFETAIRANYGNEFNGELQKLSALIAAQDLAKGDQVWITNIPKYGLHIHLQGKKADFVPGVRFSKAIWDIYLGPKNVGEAVKKALVSRL